MRSLAAGARHPPSFVRYAGRSDFPVHPCTRCWRKTGNDNSVNSRENLVLSKFGFCAVIQTYWSNHFMAALQKVMNQICCT